MLYTICSPRKLKCTRYNFAKTRRPRRARYHLISADWLVHSFRTMRRVGAEKKHARTCIQSAGRAVRRNAHRHAL